MDTTKAEQRAHELQKIVKEYVDTGTRGVPDGPMCDMVLFIGLRYLYVSLNNHSITREEAKLEKKKLLTTYMAAANDQEFYLEQAQHRNRIASELVKLEQCGCEHCKRMIRLIDGRNTV